MYIMFMFMHMLCISYYVIWLVIDVMTYDDVIEEQTSLYSEKDLCLKKDLLKTIKKRVVLPV